jgi:hypothetical protein
VGRVRVEGPLERRFNFMLNLLHHPLVD